jgi:hypothetical protein
MVVGPVVAIESKQSRGHDNNKRFLVVLLGGLEQSITTCRFFYLGQSDEQSEFTLIVVLLLLTRYRNPLDSFTSIPNLSPSHSDSILRSFLKVN